MIEQLRNEKNVYAGEAVTAGSIATTFHRHMVPSADN